MDQVVRTLRYDWGNLRTTDGFLQQNRLSQKKSNGPANRFPLLKLAKLVGLIKLEFLQKPTKHFKSTCMNLQTTEWLNISAYILTTVQFDCKTAHGAKLEQCTRVDDARLYRLQNGHRIDS